MYKKVINYTSYDGENLKYEAYFNLNKAELMKWIMGSRDYSIDKLLERMLMNQNKKELMGIFDELIDMSYGEKSLDGRRFMKTPEILANFKATEAYSEFFMELCSDTNKVTEFILGIVPAEMVDEITKAIKENPDGIPAEMKDYVQPIINNNLTVLPG